MEDGKIMAASTNIQKELLKAQQSERTEFETYKRLALQTKNKENKTLLLHIAEDEKKHYAFWKKYTKRDISANWFKVYIYVFLSRIFGLVFAVSLMEKKEECSQLDCKKLLQHIPHLEKIIKNERKHEKELLKLINEERQKYIGSIVLGISDALVELTGALAGLTFALQNTRLIALAGLITGIAASLSMASSEYQSTKAERTKRKPLTAAFYTGLVYFLTVMVLVVPFLILKAPFLSLFFTLASALLIIGIFTYYVSVTQKISFRKRFIEMAAICMSVAALSFILGYILRIFFGLGI